LQQEIDGDKYMSLASPCPENMKQAIPWFRKQQKQPATRKGDIFFEKKAKTL